MSKITATQALKAYLDHVPVGDEVNMYAVAPVILRTFPTVSRDAMRQAFIEFANKGHLRRLARGRYKLMRRNFYVWGGGDKVRWPTTTVPTVVHVPPTPYVDLARANAPRAPYAPAQQELPLVNPPKPSGKLVHELTLREATVGQLEDAMLDIITELSYRARKGERA